MSDHLSKDPHALRAIYDQMIVVMTDVTAGTMGVDAGETVAKAGHVACKSVEVDLHSRIFEHKITALAGRRDAPQIEASAQG